MLIKSQSAISKKRRARERDELVMRIKDIAREMFVRDGYEAVTLHRIATALEYTRPPIYRYFKDKDDLLTAIVLEDMGDLQTKLLECATIADPLERLVEMARRHCTWATENPNHYLLFYTRAWIEREDAVRAELASPVELEPLHLLYKAVEELISQGKSKNEYQDAGLVAKTIWAAMHGTIMLEITMSDYDRMLLHDRDRPFQERLDTLMYGLMRGFLRE